MYPKPYSIYLRGTIHAEEVETAGIDGVEASGKAPRQGPGPKGVKGFRFRV